MDSGTIDLNRILADYKRRDSTGFVIISEPVFEKILGKISDYVLQQNKVNETIRALKRIYYDNIKVLKVLDEADDVARNTIRNALRRSLSEVMGETDQELQGIFDRYKKVTLKTIWTSGVVVKALRERGEDLNGWCNWNSILLI
jgi:hypothetical protein